MALRWLTRKTAPRGDAEERALTRETMPAAMLTAAPGPAVTAQNALGVADAYACVRVLADAAASLPLIVYRRTATGRERMGGRSAELLQRPSPATTQAGLIGQMVAHLNLYGNAYLGKFRDPDGRVEQLALLAPERVLPAVKAGRPLYTVTGPKGERSMHGPADVIHVRALTTDGILGLSPVGQCRVALGLSQQLAEHAARFFENDARPAGVLKVNQFGGSDAQVEALRSGFDARHRGTANAHRIAVLTGEVDFLPLSMPLDDAQFLEQRRLSGTEVARCFRVPPWMIGADTGSSMTYANVEQQALAFVTYSLRPWLVLIEQALSADEDLFAGPHYCEFLLDAILRADSATRAQVYTAALDPTTGWMTREEVRRLENLEPEDGSRERPGLPGRLPGERPAGSAANGAGPAVLA